MIVKKPTATKETVWTFLNVYYAREKTTPQMKVIETALCLKNASLKGAIRMLEKEGYIRISRSGTHKFIILTRMGRYV